jgi:hypothetical protein
VQGEADSSASRCYACANGRKSMREAPLRRGPLRCLREGSRVVYLSPADNAAASKIAQLLPSLVLFNGGQGGAPDQPEVQRRVSVLLQSLLAEDILAAEAAPTLADLLWWKGDRVAVVEIAVQVNGEDVRRAVQRAKTLQQGGAQAMAMVIGESWATPDTRERTRTLGIDWKVSADLSEGFLSFRRLTAERVNGTG